MRCHFGLMGTVLACATAAYGQTVGANLSTGVGVGVNLPGRHGAGGAVGAGPAAAGAGTSLEQRAAISVGGRGPADPRQVGPNFNSARMGAGLGGPGDGHRMGASATGAAGFQARRDERFGDADRGGRPDDRRPDERPDRAPNDQRPPSDDRQQPPPGQNGTNQSHPHDPRLLPPLDVRNRAALQADLFLANRLAEIDRLRDVAVTNNDAPMLLRADHLEMEARQHHEFQVRRAAAAVAMPDRMSPPPVAVGATGAYQAGLGQAPPTQSAYAEGRFDPRNSGYGPPNGPPQFVPPPFAVNGAATGDGVFVVRDFPSQAAAHASAQGQANASAAARPFAPGPIYLPGPMPERATAEGTVQAGYSNDTAQPAPSGVARPESEPMPQPTPPAGEAPADARRPRDLSRAPPYFRMPFRHVDVGVGAAATATSSSAPASTVPASTAPAPGSP